MVFCAGAQSFDSQLFARARTLEENGDAEAAQAAYREVLSYYPSHYAAWNALGELYLETRRSTQARWAFAQALRYNPRWPRASRNLAHAWERMGQVDSARVQLQRCLPFVEGNEQVAVKRDIARLRRGTPRADDDEDAGDGIEAVIPVPSRTPEIESLFQKAVAQYEGREYQRALNTIRAVLARQPDHGGAYYYGGLIRRRWGQDRLARINFQKGRAYPALGHNASFYLGKLHGEAQEYQLAVSYLRHYLQHSTYQAGIEEAHSLIRRYRTALGDSVGDIDVLAQLRSEERETVPEWVIPEAGMVRFMTPALRDTLTVALPAADRVVEMLRRREFSAAAGLLEEWLMGATDTASVPLVLFNLGVCRMGEGRYDQARAYLKRFTAQAPSHELTRRAAFLVATTECVLGNHETAEESLRRLTGPRAQERWVWKALETLGDCRDALGRVTGAVKAYGRAMSRAPTAEDAMLVRYKLGVCLLRAGRLPAALSTFETIVDDASDDVRPIRRPAALYRIGDILFLQGQYVEALQRYEQVIAQYSEYLETPWGFYQIAAIHTRRGMPQPAQKVLEVLRTRHPDDYWSRQAAWRWPLP